MPTAAVRRSSWPFFCPRMLIATLDNAGGGRVSYIWGLLVCVAMLACGGTSASATMRIVDDHGGQVGKYLQAFAEVRSTGERVIIDSDRLSACTLVLGLVPSNQICATPRARFGSRAPLILKNEGLLVTSPSPARRPPVLRSLGDYRA